VHVPWPQVMCMTNGSVDIATGVLQKAGCAELVDSVMDVAQCRAWKPAAAAYRHAVESPGFGLQPGEVSAVAHFGSRVRCHCHSSQC
jgi:2-haloacid dehalogenase